MPNGSHDFDRTEMELWFAPLAPAIRQFASQHGLHIVKYYHDIPSWSLQVAHPSGGFIGLDVVRSQWEDIVLGSGWHLDDLAARKRLIHRRPTLRLTKDASVLAAHLEQELAALRAAKADAWTMVSDLM